MHDMSVRQRRAHLLGFGTIYVCVILFWAAVFPPTLFLLVFVPGLLRRKARRVHAAQAARLGGGVLALGTAYNRAEHLGSW